MAWDRKKLIAYASGIPTPDFVAYLNSGGGGGSVSVGALIAGAGLAGGGDPMQGDVTISLGASGVAAGSYGSVSQIPEITVDEHGRVTAVAEHTVTVELPDVVANGSYGGNNTFLSLTVDAKGRIVDIGESTFTLADTGIVAGSYGSSTKVPHLTLDAKGRVTAVTEQDIALANSGVTAGSYGSSSKSPHITVGLDGRITAVTEQDIIATLPDVTAAGTYGTAAKTPQITIDAKGRITSVAEVDTTATLPDVGTAGTYGSSTQVPRFTLDAKGRVTAVSLQTITATLADSGVTAGTYGSASKVPAFTVDSKGRITGVTEYTVTAILGNNGVTAGTYGTSSKVPQITVDATGRVTNVAEVAVSGGSGTSHPWYWNPPSSTLLPNDTTSASNHTVVDDSNVGFVMNQNLQNGSGIALGRVGDLLTAATSFLIEAHLAGMIPYTNSATAANVLCAGILLGDDAGHWVCFGILSKGGIGLYKSTTPQSGSGTSMTIDTEDTTIPVSGLDDIHLTINRRTGTDNLWFGFSKTGSRTARDKSNNNSTVKYGSQFTSARTAEALGLTGNITKCGIGIIKNTGLNFLRELTCDNLHVTQPYA